jgi:uncharacterized protein involved in exopolysaccharide biosynthesis
MQASNTSPKDLGHDSPTADLMELFDVLWRGKWWIILPTLLTAAAVFFVAFVVMPPKYRAVSVLLPVKGASDLDMLTTELLSSLPIRLDTNADDQGESILAFLESSSMQGRLIEKEKLLPVLYAEDWDEAASAWKTRPEPSLALALQEEAVADFFSVKLDDELLRLSWRDEDPKRAAHMLKSITQELAEYLEDEYVSDAGRRRVFLQEQTVKAEEELQHWENLLPGPDMPEQTIFRERLAARTVYVELKKQLALARIAEAERRPDFKVLDPPFVPVKPDRLRSILAVFAASLFVFFLSCALVLMRRFLSLWRAWRNACTAEAAPADAS